MAARVTPEQRRTIAKMGRAGHTLSAIAKALGLDRHTVARHVQAAGEPATRAPAGAAEPGLTEDELARLRYVLAGWQRAVRCPACHEAIWLPTGHERGDCHWCGERWTTTPARPTRAGQPF